MNDLICFNHLRWDFVRQRPQHVLSRLAKDYRVLFVEEPIANAQIKVPKIEFKVYDCGAAKVTVACLHYPLSPERWIGHGDPLTQDTYCRLLRDYLRAEQYHDPIIWLYTPMALDFARFIPHSLLIFDVMDQLSAFKGAPVELRKQERATLLRADIVFTGGVSLFFDKRPANINTHLFPNGVDAAHFGQAISPTRLPIPADITDLEGTVLGYCGVIDERMDLPLLAHLAAAHPEWNIILVGPVVKIDPADLPKAPNIHYIGMQSYADLPAYLARFDVALIPFTLNESTRFISPTNTLEYMAAHKPIVSTPINDVIELYGAVVHIGRDPIDFEQQVQTALAESPAERRGKENRLLAMYSWDSIVLRMKQIIKSRLFLTTHEPRTKHAIQPAGLNPTQEVVATAGDR